MGESTPVFADGLGRRVLRVSAPDAHPVEHLLLDPVLGNHPGFTAALRERAAALQGKRLTGYARVVSVELDAPAASVVSEYVPGWRLADVLDVAESENLTFDIGVVMLLLRQLLPTAALLSTQGRDSASGALGTEHLILTPQGRLVLTDYVIGPAIDALGWGPDQLWQTLRVAMPLGTGGRAVSQRGDVIQVGVTVLSLVLGRRLRDDEFPERLEGLVKSARQKTPAIVDAPLSPGLGDWLLRALQLGAKNFATLFEAQMALERLLTSDLALLAQPSELDQAVARFERFMPTVELPEPPLMAPPPPDLVPLAVAFDRPVPPPPLEPVAEPAETAPPAPVSTVEATMEADRDADEAPVAPGLGDAPIAARAAAPAPSPVTEAAVRPEPAAEPPKAAAQVVPMRTAAHVDQPASAERDDYVPVASAPDLAWWQSGRLVAALFVVALVQTAVLGWLLTRPSENLGADGELVVNSQPQGATVVVDDREHGVTPLTMRIAPGTHVLQVRAGSAEPRVIPLSIRPGVQTAQYVEMQGVATTGVLEVRSEPSKAKVTIDGRERGSTPLTLRDVAPGNYKVVLERGGWKSTQNVRIDPGTTAQLVVPIR